MKQETDMVILLILIIIAALAVYKLLPVFSGGHQVFTDIIIENVSASGYNKSGELQLFWLILVVGSLLLLGALALKSRFSASAKARLSVSPKSSGASRDASDISDDGVNSLGDGSHASIANLRDYRFPLYGCMFLIPFFVYLIAFGQFSVPLFAGAVIFILCYYLIPGCRNLTGQVLLTYGLTYYALVSLLTVLVQLVKPDRTDSAFSSLFASSSIFGFLSPSADSPSSAFLYLVTLIAGTLLSAIFIVRYRNSPDTAFGRRLLLILQCLLPGLLTLWLVDDYLYQGQMIQVSYALGYTVFFGLLIGISLIFFIRQAVKYWNKNEKYIVGALTPILIFVYHSFSAAPMYAQPDQHHHGEQMIPWNQIFVHGQSLYDEYTPVSGLFPFVNGLIQHGFLGGTVTDYSPAISITVVIFCIVTMYLIYKHVGGGYATAFAVLFTLPSYNRQYMVLPVLLLLTLPGLLKKKNLWLQVWIFSCFLSGLYYPLYGAGVLIGTLPLGVYQIVTYVKSGSLKKDGKTVSFYVTWVILLLIVTWNIPLLIRMLKHTLTYSSQTVLADGITLLGQTAPDSFLPFLRSHSVLRNACYISFRFLLPIVGVWVFVWLIHHALRSRKDNRRDLKQALILSSGAIALMMSYTYTLVRADTDKILSRTAMVLIAVAGMFLPIMLIHYGKSLQKHSTLAVVIGALVSLPMAIYMQTSWTKFPDMWVYPDGESQLVMDDASKLYSYYEVPETFLKSEDTGLSDAYQALLGRGFMVADQIHYIEDYAAVIEKCEAVSDDVAYMAFDGQGFYDYLGVKCSATGYIPAARSYEAQKEIWDAASENLPVVFYLQPQSSYYIFRFMLEEGYVYCAEDSAFYPPELYALIYEGSDATASVAVVSDESDGATAASDEKGSSGSTATLSGDDYRPDAPATDFGCSAASFGASMDTLQDLFITEQTVSLSEGSLPDRFDGADYDFLYLELGESLSSSDAIPSDTIPSDANLKIIWSDTEGNTFENSYADCTVTDDRRLLIPMGMNACWLLSEIDDFRLIITVPADGTANGADNGSVSADGDILYETTYKRLKTSEEDSAFIKELSLMQLNIHR